MIGRKSSKTTAADGSVTEVESVQNRDGSASSLQVAKDSTGAVDSIEVSTTSAAGVTETANYEGKTDGSLTLAGMETASSDLVIPDTITGVNPTESYIVTRIGEEAFEGQKLDSVTLPTTISTVDKNAFKDCGITKLNITGKVNKTLLEKNALKGNGSGKKGKGLTINVTTRKYQKALKKQLKKAGVPKAEVEVVK